MTYILSKTLFYLFMPLAWVFLFAILSFYVKDRLKKPFQLTSFCLLIFFSNPLISNYCFGLLEIQPQQINKNKKYDIGIVLTGMLKQNKSPKDRIYVSHAGGRYYHTLRLYKEGVINKILISGGSAAIIGTEKKEAEELKKAFLIGGVLENDLIIESESRNTHENALNSAKIIKEKHKGSSLLLITSAFHMRRSEGCFKKVGLDFDTFPVNYYTSDFKWTPNNIIIPSEESLYRWKVLLHECIGIIAYKALGRT